MSALNENSQRDFLCWCRWNVSFSAFFFWCNLAAPSALAAHLKLKFIYVAKRLFGGIHAPRRICFNYFQNGGLPMTQYCHSLSLQFSISASKFFRLFTTGNYVLLGAANRAAWEPRPWSQRREPLLLLHATNKTCRTQTVFSDIYGHLIISRRDSPSHRLETRSRARFPQQQSGLVSQQQHSQSPHPLPPFRRPHKSH